MAWLGDCLQIVDHGVVRLPGAWQTVVVSCAICVRHLAGLHVVLIHTPLL